MNEYPLSGTVTEPYSLTVAGAVADFHRFPFRPIALNYPGHTPHYNIQILGKINKKGYALEALCNTVILV